MKKNDFNEENKVFFLLYMYVLSSEFSKLPYIFTV